jgi:hypothetical protein
VFRSLRFYDGVEDLCHQLGLEVPRIHRW